MTSARRTSPDRRHAHPARRRSSGGGQFVRLEDVPGAVRSCRRRGSLPSDEHACFSPMGVGWPATRSTRGRTGAARQLMSIARRTGTRRCWPASTPPSTSATSAAICTPAGIPTVAVTFDSVTRRGIYRADVPTWWAEGPGNAGRGVRRLGRPAPGSATAGPGRVRTATYP